jgi:hypothetical protein
MKRSKEKPIEQLFAEVQAALVDIEEIRLPSLEAKVRDIRDVCKGAYEILSRIEHRVVVQKRTK